MKRRLHLGSRRFDVAPAVRPTARTDARPPLPRRAAVALLRQLAADPENLLQLRALLAGLRDGVPVHRLEDAAVLARVTVALQAGRLEIGEVPSPGLRLAGDRADDAPPAPSAARAPQAPRTWIEIQLIGEDGKPIPGERYRLELPDGSTREGTLDRDGLARVDGLDPGMCQVTFPDLDQEAWKRI